MAIICLTALSCGSTNLQFNKDSDINFNTSTVTTNDKRTFHVKNTDLSKVNKCLETNPNLVCEKKINLDSNDTTIDSRQITKRANPLFELFTNKANFKINYEIGIDEQGKVIIVRVQSYEGNINSDQAHKSALNLMSMTYEEDRNAQCLTVGRYSLIAETE